jgi:hypothetical protein
VKPYFNEDTKEKAANTEQPLEAVSPRPLTAKRQLRQSTKNKKADKEPANTTTMPSSNLRIEITPYVPDPSEQIFIPELDESEEVFALELELILAIENQRIAVYLTEKENRDRELSLELRQKGIITTLGEPFEASRRKEIEGLIARGVFEIIDSDSEEIRNARIFGSRTVNEIKGKETTTPYEKTRLVIQAFNDEGKKAVLT